METAKRVSIRFSLFIILLQFCISLPLTAQPASRCEDLFIQNKLSKNKFIQPSLEISKAGQIKIKATQSDNIIGKFINSFVNLFVRKIGVDKIEIVTQRLMTDVREKVPFWIKLSDAFGLEIKFDETMLATIPRIGPLMIVSNHPMNGVEGIALAALISKVRPDVKIVMTPLLGIVPQMAEHAIFANPYGGEAAKLENVAARSQMEEHLRSGGAMVIFPSGTVSGKSKLSDKTAEDGMWKKGAYDIVSKVPATKVVPIFVEGGPSQTFHAVTLWADKLPRSLKRLRVGIGGIFHVREIASRVDTAVPLVIGRAFEGNEVLSWGKASQVMDKLRRKTYELKNVQTIAPPGDREVIQAELKSRARVIFDMDPSSDVKRMKVYLARGSDIPNVLKELGRLREITFRSVGEGSGKSRDIDEFDAHYMHFIVIDKATGEIAGAYRMGLVDEILSSKGLAGLYTNQFFDLSKVLNNELLNTLELGRSFVLPQYQQRSFALMVLFSGIGHFIVENPKYKYLMGPVSISNEITDRSKALIMGYVAKFYSSDQADLVQGLNADTQDLMVHADDISFLDKQSDLRELTNKVKEIESSFGKKTTLPPLIPIYISLGAKFFKFNFDKDFNTYDGLILTNLSELSVDQLKNYLGEEGAASFLKQHATFK